MDRKRFLQTLGLLALAVVGLGALVRSPKHSRGVAQKPATSAPTPKDTYGS